MILQSPIWILKKKMFLHNIQCLIWNIHKHSEAKVPLVYPIQILTGILKLNFNQEFKFKKKIMFVKLLGTLSRIFFK